MIRTVVIIIWFLLVMVFRLPSKLSFWLVGLAILASLAFRIGGAEGFALRLMTYAYGFAIIGAVSLLKEIRKDV